MSVLSNLSPLVWSESLNILVDYCCDYAVAQ